MVLAVVAAALATIGATRADAVTHAADTLDVEIAVDSTGSMGPLIAQAQQDANAIIDAVLTLDPDARFAVVAFRDPAYPAPEYEVLQRFTANTAAVKSAIAKLKSVTTTAPPVDSEAYNLVFDRSVSDASLGWRPSSRKVVVVLGDGEPHGAGTVGVRGCRDTAPDPHGLNTVDALAKMHTTGRTLLMVRQKGTGGATLECYGSIAALAAPGGAARDAGSSDLAGPIRALLDGTAVTLEASAGFPLALPGTTRALWFRIQNSSGGTASLDAVRLLLPRGTSFMSSAGRLGRPSIEGGQIAWAPAAAFAPGASHTHVVRVRVGANTARATFRITVGATLTNGRKVAVSSDSRIRIGRSLTLKVVGSSARELSKGSVSFTYPPSARSLVGATAARGTVRFNAGSTQIAIRLSLARIRAAAARTEVVARGVVTSSNRASCTKGAGVTVRFVDRDVAKPRTVPDLLSLVGKGCGTRAAVDVITR